MYTLFIIVATIVIYVATVWLSILIDNACDKIDPHHNESLWYMLLPFGFNIIVESVFYLILYLNRDKYPKEDY